MPLKTFCQLYRQTWLTVLISLSNRWFFSIHPSITNYSRHSHSSMNFFLGCLVLSGYVCVRKQYNQTGTELRTGVFNTYIVGASLFQPMSNLGSKESPGGVGNISFEEAHTLSFLYYNGLCHVQILCLHRKQENPLKH